jgi:transposase
MSSQERRRLTEFSRVRDGLASVAETARRLGLSKRQGWRLWRRYGRQGDAGLIHKLRGKPGNAARPALRAAALALYRRKYGGFGAAHAADLMARQERLEVSRKTLWRWLKAEGLIVKERKVKKHRCRRIRRSRVGELIQMDGSTHQWFGPGHPPCVLFVMIDDASSQVFARLYESEDTAAAFDLFGQYVKRNGLPGTLYVDHDSIYVVNDPEARQECRQAGRKEPQTQFGRAMDELGVTIMCAHSPQAKGRVERVNGTLQDRLVKELKLAGISTIAAANVFLEKYLRIHNQQFGQAPASGVNVHRRVAAGVKLEDVLCLREARVVGEDWCVSFMGRILQIDKTHAALGLAGRKVEVLRHLHSTLKLIYRGRPLVWKELGGRPAKPPEKRSIPIYRAPWRPGPHHPWNRAPACGHAMGLPGPIEKNRGVVKPVPLQAGSLRSPSFRSTGLTTPPSGRTLLLRR